MTIKDFLALPAEAMLRMSDNELLDHFGAMLAETRPKNAFVVEPKKEKKPRKKKEPKVSAEQFELPLGDASKTLENQ